MILAFGVSLGADNLRDVPLGVCRLGLPFLGLRQLFWKAWLDSVKAMLKLVIVVNRLHRVSRYSDEPLHLDYYPALPPLLIATPFPEALSPDFL